ncbi:MAG: hypothetical protein ABJD68_01725, partial [Nakamurella sp.]
MENDAANTVGQRQSVNYDIRDPLNIVVNFNPLIADDYALSMITDGVTLVTDRIKAARADFVYTPENLSLLQSAQ